MTVVVRAWPSVNLGRAYAALGDGRTACGYHHQRLALTRERGDRQAGGISTTSGSATITDSDINANQVNSSGTALGGDRL